MLRFFPKGFNGESYFGTEVLTPRVPGERNDKLRAHRRYAEMLGDGQAEALLARGEIQVLADRVCAIPTDNLNLMNAKYKAGLDVLSPCRSLI